MSELMTLSNDLNVITAEINSYKQIAGHAMYEIGVRLMHARDEIFSDEKRKQSGEWRMWIEQECGFSLDYASELIRAVITHQGSETSRRLSFSKLIEINKLPMSDEEKRKFIEESHTIPSTGETKTVEDMTVKELREVKKALKATETANERLTKEAEQAKESARTAQDELKRVKLQADSDRTLLRQEVREQMRQEFAAKERQLSERITYLETNPTIVEREDPALKSELARLKAELEHATGELQRKTGVIDKMSDELDDLYAVKDRLEAMKDGEVDAGVQDALQAQIDAKEAEIDRLNRELETQRNPRDLWGMLKDDRVAGLTNETHTRTIKWAADIAQTLMLAEQGVSVAGIAAEMHLETIAQVEQVLAKLKAIRVVSDEELAGEVVVETVVTPRWIQTATDVKVIG